MNKDRRKKIEALKDKLEEVITNARDEVKNIKGQLDEIKDEEQESFDALPDSLQCSERGEAMENAITNLEEADSLLDDLIINLDSDDICSSLDEAIV